MKAADTRIEASALCVTCRWKCAARNAMAAGSEHARRRYHKVVVTEHRTVHFDGSVPPEKEGAPRLPL